MQAVGDVRAELHRQAGLNAHAQGLLRVVLLPRYIFIVHIRERLHEIGSIAIEQ